MGPTGDAINVVQIHPTLRCNLRCQHCYSASGPELAGGLRIEALEGLLPQLAAEGFNAISVSGGEPLMYAPLPRLLKAAAGLGMVTSLTSNGLLLTERRLGEIAPYLRLLAVSIDGIPASHNRLRDLPTAFEKMKDKLGVLRRSGVPFGIIFTLTRHNLPELAWVADFAAEQGAAQLQVHPLEGVGRAAEYELVPPDDLELTYAFLEIAKLQEKHRDRLAIQYDAADRTVVASDPSRAFAVAEGDPEAVAKTPLAALVSPLVVQDDGWIVPVQYGFSRDFAVGRVGEDLRRSAAAWRCDRYGAFLRLTRRVWDEIGEAPAHLPFTNWYAAVTTRSHLSAAHPGESRDPSVAEGFSTAAA